MTRPTPEEVAAQTLEAHAIRPHWNRNGEQVAALIAEAVRADRAAIFSPRPIHTPGELAEEAARAVVTARGFEHTEGEPFVEALAWALGGQVDYPRGLALFATAAADVAATARALDADDHARAARIAAAVVGRIDYGGDDDPPTFERAAEGFRSGWLDADSLAALLAAAALQALTEKENAQ